MQFLPPDEDENGSRLSFRECQGCGTVWHDDDPSNGEHHYPWCPLASGRNDNA